MLEESQEFTCPYCAAENSIFLDVSGGRKQVFVQDCEICCQPIQILVQWEGEELVSFTVERENP